jgi:hypothetical protein
MPGGERAIELARAVCIAVIVEPALMRRARRVLVRRADAGAESDLWFSPLVLTRNVTGLVLDPDVLHALRTRLAEAKEWKFADRAYALVQNAHEQHPDALQLEEAMIWASIVYERDPAPLADLEHRLKAGVKAMHTAPDGGRRAARWVAEAWPRLSESARGSEAALLLAAGASLRLGDARSLVGEGGLPDKLGWLAPRGETVELGVELLADGLRFVQPNGDDQRLVLPATSPLILEVTWNDRKVHRTVTRSVRAGAEVSLGSLFGPITLRTLAGRRYVLEPETPPTPLRVYVSYGRDESAPARILAQQLGNRFGEKRVWFDTQLLEAGSRWRDEIVAAVADADVTIVVIGPRWPASPERQRSADGAEDVLRLEIERALRTSNRVIPVLVNGAVMPRRSELPRAFRALAELEAFTLRFDSWDADVQALIEVIEGTRRQPLPAWEGEPTPPAETETSDGESRRVARYLERGTLMFFLGSGVNSAGQPPGATRDPGAPPDADELARRLARDFDLENADLAAVAQEVRMTWGARDLDRSLRKALSQATPGPLHRWFAALPGMLRRHGHEEGQLLITLNYDDALERAFNDVHEPYDLAVFIADGPDAGRFLHVPWWSAEGPRLIAHPNEYADFPIDEYGELERTVIVKLLGSVTIDAAAIRSESSYVIAEDDYIDYLSGAPIEALLPVQILDKIRDSHALFVAGSPRDRGLRVLTRRLWSRDGLTTTSWAVQREMDEFERESWARLNVRPWEVDPLECLTRLGAQLVKD